MVKNVLLLDSGNTRLKYLFNEDAGFFESDAELRAFLLNRKPEFVLFASVSDIENTLIETLKELNLPYDKAVVQDSFLGVSLAYKDVQTLGVDRWLSILAAAELFPDNPLIVVNAGTALTIDCIDSKKQHKGGSISPGIKLLFAALECKTALLPLVQPKVNHSIGTDTESCINYGVIQSLVSLIEATVKKFDTSAILLMSGGDASFLSNFLTTEYQKVPNLVLKGLELYYEFYFKRGFLK